MEDGDGGRRLRLIFPVHDLGRDGDKAGEPIAAVALAAQSVDEDNGTVGGGPSVIVLGVVVIRVVTIRR